MTRALRYRPLLAGALFALVVAAAAGCPDSSARGGEVDGEVLYFELCARCHGPEGQPTPSMVARHGVKDLTAPEVQSEMSEDDIRQQILRGSENRQMPAFGGAISEAQVDALADYVKTLSAE